MSGENNMAVKKGNLTAKQVNIYGAYLMFSGLAAMVQMTYQTLFMTDVLLIDPALVATTLLVARIIDLFVGILAGAVIEKAHLKHGKYRSWLLMGRWFVIFGLVCSFFNTSSWPLGFRIGVGFVGYLILNGAFSFVTNAYYGLGPALAGGNMNDRFRLSARGAQFMCISLLISSACTVPLITALSPIIGAGWAYLVVSLLFAVPFIFGIQALNSISRESDPDDQTSRSSGATITIKDMVNSVLKNPQMQVIFFAYSIYYVGLYIMNNLVSYYFIYLAGNFNLMAVSMTITTITGTVASLIVPKIGNKIGKKKAFVAAMIIYSLALLGMGLIAKGNWIIYTVFATIGGAFIYLFTGFGPNYFIDCGEYYLYKTGKDTRNIAVALFSVPMKIGMLLGGAIGVFGLAVIGYKPQMQVTPDFITHFMIVMTVLPAVLMLIGALICQVGYKLTDEKAAFYAEENVKRMKR